MVALTNEQIDAVKWAYLTLEKGISDSTAVSVIPTNQRYELMDTDWRGRYNINAEFENFMGRVRARMPFADLVSLSKDTQKARAFETGTINHIKNLYREEPDKVELIFPAENITEEKLAVLNATMRFAKPLVARGDNLVMSLSQYRGIMSFCQANVDELNRGGSIDITKMLDMIDNLRERLGISPEEGQRIMGEEGLPVGERSEPRRGNDAQVVGYGDVSGHETKMPPRIRGLAAVEAAQEPAGLAKLNIQGDRPNAVVESGGSEHQGAEILRPTFGKPRIRQ